MLFYATGGRFTPDNILDIMCRYDDPGDPMTERPNILFIMTDQQRHDAMGCSGGWVETPNLDRIAASGVRFANCYTNSPVCVPTRLSLATGCYPHTTGLWDNAPHDLSPHCPTWMQAVRAAGYRTSLFGKTHLHRHEGSDLRDREHLMRAYGWDDIDEIGGPRASTRVGSHMTARWESLGLWDAYRADYKERFSNVPHVVRPSPLPLEEYADVYVGRRAAEYLEGYDREQPWCCCVSFGGPHEPWDTPREWAERYRDAEMPPPIPRAEWMTRGDTALARRCARREQGYSPEESLAMRRDYAANVALIDDQVGRLLAVLEQRGELERSVIVFTSDHGEHNGDAGLIYKSTLLDAAARVPLLLSVPGAATDAVADTPCELFDVGATIADLAGAELHPQFARSLLPAAHDPARQVRDYATCEHQGELMLATRSHKLLLDRRGRPYALLDRRGDPDEQSDLSTDPAQAQTLNELRLQAQEFLLANQLHKQREFTAREADLVAPAPSGA